VATAFPSAKVSQDFLAPMLPGFRFLFAAIMLSLSLFVFGLGAASLLRAAHETFASNASWRATPEVSFAQRPEPALPVLATLRVDTGLTDNATDQTKAGAAPAISATPAVQPPPVASETHDQAPAAKPTEPQVETAKPDLAPADVSTIETPPAPEVAPPTAETAVTDPKMAAVTASDLPSASSEPVVAQPEAVIAPSASLPPANPASTNPTADQTTAAAPSTVASPTPEAEDASTKIATLGGPPVDIMDMASAGTRTAKSDQAQLDQAAIKKRLQAKRAAHRRRLELRARQLAQQQLLPGNPFAPQPLPVTPIAAQRR
jgi:hypothetical protein